MENNAMPAGVLPLRSVGAADLATAGGKAANLGELIRIGMPVPDGFVITTDADPGTAGVMPADLRAAVIDAYRRLGSGRVAVRSSATAEDLPGAAFAGQQDTYLDIEGDEALIDAVHRCWASLWTERAVAYRERLGIAPQDVAIAVVVQQMVPAAVAGVLFTADPVSGERDTIIIDAAPGLGEAVVSGLVTPDHYRLDRHDVVVEHRAGEVGTIVGSAETAAADGELRPEELSRLAELARRVADHYRRPMDLEWAVTRDHPSGESGDIAPGTVRLLQARPMTGLPGEPVELTRVQRATNQIVLDYLAVRPYPLDMSTWTSHGVARMLAAMAGGIGVRLDLAGAFVETDGVVSSFRPVDPRPTRATLGAPISVLRRARRFTPDRWRDDPRYRRYRQQLSELNRQPPASLSMDQLLQRVHAILSVAQAVTVLRVDYLPGVGVALGRLLVITTLLGRRRLFADLIAGAPTVTTKINNRLAELAALARATPAVLSQARSHPSADLLTALRADPACKEFVVELEDFLDDYGCRETDSPLVVSSPTWFDAPGRLLDLIMMLAEDEQRSDQHDQDRDAADRLLGHPLLRRPAIRRRVFAAIERARDGMVVREDTHFEMMRPLPLLRATLIDVGRRLTDATVLDTPEDVWHLRLEEIEELGAPEQLEANTVARVRALVEQRRMIRAAHGNHPLLNAVADEPVGDAVVSGSPASAGHASGPVRIIRGPDDFSSLLPGEVLVCPSTNPSWTPLFHRAAAVIADAGGPASHAAIVAREYGIPAVMGTRNGTSRLTDGQQVTVDGDHGQVR